MEECKNCDVCRVCLCKESENDLLSVFSSDEKFGLKIHLAEMIMAFASVQVNFGDGLPEKICSTCAENTSKFYLFKLKCEESDRRLRSKLGEPSQENSEIISDTEQPPVEELEKIIIKNEPLNVETKTKDSFPESQDNVDIEFIDETNEFLDSFTRDESESDDDDYEPLNKQDQFFDFSDETLAKCPQCSSSFSKITELNRHLKTHGEYKPFNCDLCKKKFTRNDLLIRHKIAHAIKLNQDLESLEEQEKEKKDKPAEEDNKIVHSSEDTFPCPRCKSVFESSSEFEKHLETHKPVKCDQCSKTFTKQSHLKRHLKTHSETKPYVCHLCNKGFVRHKQLTNHLNVHSGIKPHVCNICAKGFNQISNLKDHMRTHNGEKPFLCSTCGKGFNQLGNLRQHTVRHTGIKAHLCNTCGSGFASKGELSAHLRKHTGARPFVCPICQHGFTTSSSLTKHKRIHSGEKPYVCDVCNMKFSRSGILARHKRIHTGEKPYQCTFCPKAFAQSNDLTSHLRIHTGEKPYICDSCGSAFRQSSALKTHKKTHIDKNPQQIENKPIVGVVHTFLGIFNDA